MPDMGVAKHWRHIAIASLVSLVILVILCMKAGVRLINILDDIRSVDALWLAGIFIFSEAVHVFVGSWKWLLILRGIGCPTSYGEMLFVRVGSDPVRFAMPFKLGEVSNVLYFSQTGKLPFCQSASWILFDKALNFLGTIFWLLIGLLLTGVASELKWPVVAAGCALVALLVIPQLRWAAVKIAGLFHRKLGELTRQLLTTFERIRFRRRIELIVLALLFQLRPLIVCYLLFVAMGPANFATRPAIPELLSKGSAVVVASNLPGSQAGMGYRETALVNLFSSHLANPDYKSPLVTMGILIAVAMFVVPAVIGLPFMASFIAAISARRKKSTETTAEANDDVTASFTRTPPSEDEESRSAESDTKASSGGAG